MRDVGPPLGLPTFSHYVFSCSSPWTRRRKAASSSRSSASIVRSCRNADIHILFDGIAHQRLEGCWRKGIQFNGQITEPLPILRGPRVCFLDGVDTVGEVVLVHLLGKESAPLTTNLVSKPHFHLERSEHCG
jgi:hypothetical protein